MSDSIAVLGAGGTMGRAMARNIAKAGFAVRAWDRSREKAEPLAGDGAELFDDAAEAVRGADVVLTMLTDADAVIDVAERALAAARDGAVWLQMSTIGISGFERSQGLAEATGCVLVDAPVLGTKQPAEAGELVVLASGPEDARSRVDPILDAVGKRTLWVGEAGAGSRLKLVTNSWLVALVEGAAESVALAEALGLDPELFLDAVSGGPLDTPYLELKTKAMIARRFEPSFALRLAAKDAALAHEAAERHGLELPLVKVVVEQFSRAAGEHGDEDVAAAFLALTRE